MDCTQKSASSSYMYSPFSSLYPKNSFPSTLGVDSELYFIVPSFLILTRFVLVSSSCFSLPTIKLAYGASQGGRVSRLPFPDYPRGSRFVTPFQHLLLQPNLLSYPINYHCFPIYFIFICIFYMMIIMSTMPSLYFFIIFPKQHQPRFFYIMKKIFFIYVSFKHYLNTI